MCAAMFSAIKDGAQGVAKLPAHPSNTVEEKAKRAWWRWRWVVFCGGERRFKWLVLRTCTTGGCPKCTTISYMRLPPLEGPPVVGARTASSC